MNSSGFPFTETGRIQIIIGIGILAEVVLWILHKYGVKITVMNIIAARNRSINIGDLIDLAVARVPDGEKRIEMMFNWYFEETLHISKLNWNLRRFESLYLLSLPLVSPVMEFIDFQGFARYIVSI